MVILLQSAGNGKNAVDGNTGHHQRQRDPEKALDTAGSVHFRRLHQLRRNCIERGNIDDEKQTKPVP